MHPKQFTTATFATPGSTFTAWWLERGRLELALKEAGHQESEYTECVLARLHELERLIIETPSSDLEGARMKARLLSWLMEMETADGRVAMRHIREFLESQ